MSTAEVTSRPITIEHVRITSRRLFAQVRAAIEVDDEAEPEQPNA
jgi:hypothetical protein